MLNNVHKKYKNPKSTSLKEFRLLAHRGMAGGWGEGKGKGGRDPGFPFPCLQNSKWKLCIHAHSLRPKSQFPVEPLPGNRRHLHLTVRNFYVSQTKTIHMCVICSLQAIISERLLLFCTTFFFFLTVTILSPMMFILIFSDHCSFLL